MEIIIIAVIAFVLGALWGSWRATHSIVEQIRQDPRRFKELLQDIEQIHLDLPKVTHRVRVEWHGEHCYLYDGQDQFLAQGATVTQALALANKRYPDQEFRLNEHE